MSEEKHIADGETGFRVRAITPDFCKVKKKVVAFAPTRTLQPEEIDYAVSVFARSERVLMVKSVIDGTKNNAGKGLWSKVSLEDGHHKVLPNHSTVIIEDRQAARHDDLVVMNGKVG